MGDPSNPSTEVEVERAIESGSEAEPDSVEKMDQNAFDALVAENARNQP